MTKARSPQEIQELAAGYVLGDLNSDEAEDFQALLTEVPGLYQEVVALQETLALMPYELADVEVDSRVRSQLLAKAEAELSLTSTPLASAPLASAPLASSVSDPSKSVKIRPGELTPKLPWLISTAAAALAIACGLAIARLNGQVRFLQAQSESIDEPASLIHTWTGLSDILRDHQKSLDQPDGPVDFAVGQPSDVLDLLQGFQTTAAALPLLPAYQGKLLGGSNCQFGKVQGLRLTYQLSTNQTVSAYQLDMTDQTIPALESAQMTIQQSDGTSLVFWSDGNYLYALVATLPIPELQALARNIDSLKH